MSEPQPATPHDKKTRLDDLRPEATMSVLDDFYSCQSIQVDPIDFDIVEPPRFLGMPVFPPGPRRDPASCAVKERGSLDVRLTIESLFGLVLPLEGQWLGIDRRNRWLVRWEIHDDTDRTVMGANVESIHGQVTAEIFPMPLRTDLADCAGAPGQYFVGIRLIADNDRDDDFDRDELSDPLPNEFRVRVTLVTETLAAVTSVSGNAGITAPPARPWPQPIAVSMSRWCVPSARSTRMVSGELRLSDPIQRAHVGFDATVGAEGLDPPRPLHVDTNIVGERVFFVVALPRDLTGRVRVTGYTNDRSRARSATFSVGGGRFGCQGPDFNYYVPARLGCEPIDCGWTGLNDLGSLVGRHGGLPALYRSGSGRLDPIGRDIGRKARILALNNRDSVAGSADLADGRSVGFVRDEDEKGTPRLRLAENVTFTALNDALVAVGILRGSDGVVPIRWTEGHVEPLDLPGHGAMPLAIDGAGTVAGVWSEDRGKRVRAFLLDGQEFRDLGELPGDVIALHLNGAGVVAATLATPDGLRGMLLTADGPLEIPMPEKADSLAVAGLNDEGVAAVTLRSAGVSRAARFHPERGLEFLDGLAQDDSVGSSEALGINNLGQILVVGHEGGRRVNRLLSPAPLPLPSDPFPGNGKQAGCACGPPAAPAGPSPAPTQPGAERSGLLLPLLWLILLLLMVLILLVLAAR
jgi:hypothetical protein